MKFKKPLILVLLLCLIGITVTFLFTACGNGNDNQTDNPTTDNPTGDKTDDKTEIVTPSEGLEYVFSADGTGYSVVGVGTCTDAEIIIPSEYNGLPVNAINNNAFANRTYITNITIPDSVTSIGSYAFGGCTAEIIWGNNPQVTEIGSYAFNGYQGTSITIPDSVTEIGSYAFNGYQGTSITIPDSVTSIGDKAFSSCQSLKSLVVSSNNMVYHSEGNCIIETASKTLIAGCKNSIIPSDCSVNSIGSSAFYNCTSLASITIPDSVTSIGNDAFYGSSIEHTTMPTLAIKYVPQNNLKTVILTSGTVIEHYAFNWCISLTSITIPDSITSIGGFAFEGCRSLNAVYITDIASWCNISFGSSAANPLYYAHNLYLNDNLVTELEIPDCVTKISSGAFCGYNGTSITIPDSVTSIGNDAFYGSSIEHTTMPAIAIGHVPKDNLKTVVITSGSIGGYAFNGCTSLESVTIGDGVTYIGSSAFSGCTTEIIWGNNPQITEIGSYTFNGYQGTSITIPNSVTSIGNSAFSGCQSQSITIPFVGATKGGKSNTHFGYIYGASDYFNNSNYVPKSLKTVIITGDTSINNWAFYGCSSIVNIKIPYSVISIGDGAFNSCSNLKTVYFDGTTEQWDKLSIGSYNNLTRVTIYCYSEEYPYNDDVTDGNFWHYDPNGEIVVWVKED